MNKDKEIYKNNYDNKMKLKKISIKKMFGVFDHEVQLNNDIGITIIIGENGLGKTVMLEMIEAFFKGKFLYFNSISFEELIFEFNDGIIWILKKEKNKEGLPMLNLTQINRNKTEFNPLKLVQYDHEGIEMLAHRIGRSSPYFRRIGPRTWEDRRTRERFHIEEFVYKYGDLLIEDLFFENSEKPKWFTDKYENTNVNLIETQRLISIENRDEKSHKKTVDKYAYELSQTIKKYLTESTELSSKLDRTYPNRLIN